MQAANPRCRRKHILMNAIEVSVLAVAIALAGQIASAQTPSLSVPERVAALKTNLAVSQANLRRYEWIETTVVSLNGEEKSRKQQRCYYGADGVLQKVVVDASPPPEKRFGLRGRIIANKTAELTTYMQSAVSLVKSYMCRPMRLRFKRRRMPARSASTYRFRARALASIFAIIKNPGTTWASGSMSRAIAFPG